MTIDIEGGKDKDRRAERGKHYYSVNVRKSILYVVIDKVLSCQFSMMISHIQFS